MGEAAPGEVTQVAAATSSQDPEVGLAAVAALRGLVEVLEALQVENARAKGWAWQQIAARLGVTKQAVHPQVRWPSVRLSEVVRVTQRSEQARRVLDLAREEAERFGHRYLGPEHVPARRAGRGPEWRRRGAAGPWMQLAAARAALRRLAEQGVVPAPRPSDAELLGILGVDLDAVRRDTEQTFGVQAVGEATWRVTRRRGWWGARVV
ncbi:MAG TPA: Clp protease N-terminal domain-containing protein [Actinomycetes bacterium]|jgi:hypothetical protein|nr:Clp protease N-terminal domain-containing protein [Actinomycetes bacterium]